MALILSPRKATTNTPAIPPVRLTKKMAHGDKPNTKPAGMAAYISKVARPATVSSFRNIILFSINRFKALVKITLLQLAV